jgi:hypothetical protein
MDSSRRVSLARRPLFLLPLLLFGAACSGGGGGGPSTSIGFVGNSGQTTEGAAPLSVQVVLHTSLASLATPVSVDVVDLGTGTATSGTDYGAFAPATVTFPAGAMNGDVQSVPFAAAADLSVEGRTETVRLGFANAVGCGLGAFKVFTASIADADVATIRFASAIGSTTDESAGTTNVTIELDLPAAVSLGVPVSARVADAHTGSATPGADYAAFPSQAVTFPAGSVDGATQTVGIQVLADSTIETNETVALSLSAPSAGAVLGATTSFQLSIVDDDASGPPALVATEGPTGVESSVAYDQQLELGTQTVDAGPNAGTRLRIENAGGSSRARTRTTSRSRSRPRRCRPRACARTTLRGRRSTRRSWELPDSARGKAPASRSLSMPRDSRGSPRRRASRSAASRPQASPA